MKTMRTRGFSLLELIIYIGILSLMVVILAGSFVSLTRGRTQSESRVEVESNARFALERISQDIWTASSLVTPILSTASSTLSLSVAGTSVVYDVVNGVLRRTVNAGTAEALTSSRVVVDPPTFTRLENYQSTLLATTTSVQVSMTVRSASAAPESVYSTTLRSTIDLR